MIGSVLRGRFASLVAAILCATATGVEADEPILLLSTQLTPPNEAEAMRERILAGFPLPVRFEPNDNRRIFNLVAGRASDDAPPTVIAGLHGDLTGLHRRGLLADLGPLMGAALETVDPGLRALSVDGARVIYAPWMQATYAIAARREALDHLPVGADPDALSYDALAAWAEALARVEGAPKFGLPAGRGGLMPRFIKGYLYPSFTGGMATTVASSEAEAGWRLMRRLWAASSPRSVTFGAMADPLATGEIWLAWDHIARLRPAIDAAPEDFVVLPAPVGPKGRGYFAVVAGLALPAGSGAAAAERDLIAHLLAPETQAVTLASVGFLPVIAGPDSTTENLFAQAMARQRASPAPQIRAVLPVGLGERERDFTAAYAAAFSQIVLRERPIAETLQRQQAIVDEILKAAGQPCWPPDPVTETPCRAAVAE